MELRGWTWVPGMLARRSAGPCSGSHRYTATEVRAGRHFVGGWPDVDDPATSGHLLAMVWPHVRSMHRTPSGGCLLIVQGAPGDGPIHLLEATVGRACVRAMELRAEVGCE